MRIVFTVSGLEINSGVSAFVIETANKLAELGNEVIVLCPRLLEYKPSDNVKLVRGSRIEEVGVIPDVVHVHALWSFMSVAAMRWCIKNRVPYIVSPHGSLMPRVFTKGRIKKWLFYRLLIAPSLKSAAALHCTGDGEVHALRALKIQKEPFVAPLGCTIPLDYKKDERKEILFLGRLSEEKGLLLLLEAWHSIDHRGWRLLIAGPSWQGYGDILREKIANESISDLELLGPADAIKKDALYRAVDLFVLPSPMENFSVAVLDALAYGVPVICTQGTPWEIVRREECGWWIASNSSQELAFAISSAISLNHEQRSAMGERARTVAMSYDWKIIAKQLLSVYQKSNNF